MTDTPTHTCLNCGKPLGEPRRDAPHRKFCSVVCRYEWHGKRAKRARELLRATEDGQDGGNLH